MLLPVQKLLVMIWNMVGQTDRLTRALLCIVALTLTLFAVVNTAQIRGSSTYLGAAILFNDNASQSKSTKSLRTRVANAKQAGAPFIIISSKDPSYQTVLKQALGFRSFDKNSVETIGVFDTGTKLSHVMIGPIEVEKALNQLLRFNDYSKRSPLPWMIGLIGVLFGFAISRWIRISAVLSLMAGAIALAYLYYSRCKTCPVAFDSLPVDLSLLGTGWFVLGMVATTLLSKRNPVLIASIVLGSSSILQSILFFVEPSSCWICMSILGFSCITLSNWSVKPEENKVSRRPVFQTAFALVCVTSLVVGGVAQPNQEPISPQAIKMTKSQSLIGKSIADFKIKPEIPSELVFLLIGSSECSPCREAQVWAINKSELPFIFVSSVSNATSKQNSGYASHTITANVQIPNPTIIAIDSKGIIIEEFIGWSNDETFLKILKKRLSDIYIKSLERKGSVK